MAEKIHKVKPKKYLGQHFLTDLNIARKIVACVNTHANYSKLIEIGAGTGVLTQFLLAKNEFDLFVSEVDAESVAYLKANFPSLASDHLIEDNFLKLDFDTLFGKDKVGIIGNFPYNISSQIFFKVLDERHRVNEVVGMIQKEVAERICSREGSKVYGKLSVLLQAFYDLEVLFTVSNKVFFPRPKVESAVIRLRRNAVKNLNCDEDLFFRVVKMGFQQRRKTLRNALKTLNLPTSVKEDLLLSKRAEQLTVADFVSLTNLVSSHVV